MRQVYFFVLGINYALGKVASQSSTFTHIDHALIATKAVDGNSEGNIASLSCSHTGQGADQWWKVDLSVSRPVFQVSITNRADCCGERLTNFAIYVGDVDSYKGANHL